MKTCLNGSTNSNYYYSKLICIGLLTLFGHSVDGQVLAPAPTVADFVWISTPSGARRSAYSKYWTENCGHAISVTAGGKEYNRLYEIGGQIARHNTCTPNVIYYDVDTAKWTKLADLPVGKSHMAFAHDGTDIWMAGGYVAVEKPGGDWKVYGTTEVRKLDIVTNTWTVGPSLPEARGGGALINLNRKLHFVSGSDLKRKDVPTHWVLDLNQPNPQWIPAKALPENTTAVPDSCRNHLGGVALDGKVWIVAGQTGQDSRVVYRSRVDAYDPVSDSWTRMPDLIAPPRSHAYSATFLADNHILILGGFSFKPGTSSLEYSLKAISSYDPEAAAWSALPELPASNSFPVGGWFNNVKVVVSGSYGYAMEGFNLPPPINLRASQTAQVRGITLTWTNQALPVSGYTFNLQIERKTEIGGTWAKASPDLPNGTTSWVDTQTVLGTTYVYRARVAAAAVIPPGSATSRSSVELSVKAGLPPAVPPVPNPLITTSGDGYVQLSWSQVTGVLSYNVYRSIGSNNNYALLINLTGTSTTDTKVINGKIYFYKVTAVNATGQSGFTGEQGGQPLSSTHQDIGDTLAAGSFRLQGGTVTLSGSGVDIFNTKDSFFYYFKKWTGNGVWIAHLASLSGDNPWTKAGVIFRASLDSSAPNEALVQSLTNGVNFQSRLANASFTTRSNSAGSVPVWLKLVRVGNSFTALTSLDGLTWKLEGVRIAMASGTSGYIGLGITSHNNGVLATADFDQRAYLVTPTALVASAITASSVNFSWVSNPNVNPLDTTAFAIESSLAGKGQWSLLTSNLSPGSTSYSITGLQANTSYDFRIKPLAGIVSGDYATLGSINTLPASGFTEGMPNAWLAQYNLTGANAAAAADPDGNGIANLLEYATNLPHGAQQPATTLAVEDAGPNLKLSFTRLYPATVTYIVEGTDTLGLATQWEPLAYLHPNGVWLGPEDDEKMPAGLARVRETGTGAIRLVDVIDPKKMGVSKSRFLRLRIIGK